jgi:four helix bundle protein
MTTFKAFEDIEAWQAARALNREIYVLSSGQVFGRDFALRDQIRRASLSVMANIAEGFERDSNTEFAHFLRIAKGSAGEVRALLYAALDQEYVTQGDFAGLTEKCRSVSRRIQGLIEYLQQSEIRGLKYKPVDGRSDKIRESALQSSTDAEIEPQLHSAPFEPEPGCELKSRT